MKEELQRIIGTNLYHYRKERRMTQEELAEAADISIPFYANLESGNKMMSVVTLNKLANALQVSTDSLLRELEPDSELNDMVATLRGKPHEVVSLVSKLSQVCVDSFDQRSQNLEEGKDKDLDERKV